MQKRLFSGIQPSGNLHLGNYLGAIQHWVKLQYEYEAIFCVVDMHAITVPQDPVELRKKTLEVVKMYLAAGIDSKKCMLFVQSHVKEHAELAWILNTLTKNGDLTKMTQFKDKSSFDIDSFDKIMNRIASGEQKGMTELIEGVGKDIKKILSDEGKHFDESKVTEDAVMQTLITGLKKGLQIGSDVARKLFLSDIKKPFNSVSVGLFDYPVLMAADMLLYDTAVVPVGKDQLQHIELARTLARRFNEKFGETFVIPEGKLSQEGQLIMGLDDPTKKMSKSAASEYNYIALTDDADAVRRKIKKAVTDSGTEIVYSDDPIQSDSESDHGASKPALRNLIHIYSLLSDKSPQEIVQMYKGKGYGDFKNDLAEVAIGFLIPFQERLANISDEEALAVLKSGAEKARALAGEKMLEVKKKVGFLTQM